MKLWSNKWQEFQRKNKTKKKKTFFIEQNKRRNKKCFDRCVYAAAILVCKNFRLKAFAQILKQIPTYLPTDVKNSRQLFADRSNVVYILSPRM